MGMRRDVETGEWIRRNNQLIDIVRLRFLIIRFSMIFTQLTAEWQLLLPALDGITADGRWAEDLVARVALVARLAQSIIS